VRCLGHINADMALTQDSLTGAARRKAQRAQRKVKNAEGELETANRTLRHAIPTRDVDAIAKAAVRTAVAEDEVRDAAHELAAVTELLDEGSSTVSHGDASGEGVRSLLPFLHKR
jgi:predicted RNA-binding Zn ribbon-like protein